MVQIQKTKRMNSLKKTKEKIEKSIKDRALCSSVLLTKYFLCDTIVTFLLLLSIDYISSTSPVSFLEDLFRIYECRSFYIVFFLYSFLYSASLLLTIFLCFSLSLAFVNIYLVRCVCVWIPSAWFQHINSNSHCSMSLPAYTLCVFIKN